MVGFEIVMGPSVERWGKMSPVCRTPRLYKVRFQVEGPSEFINQWTKEGTIRTFIAVQTYNRFVVWDADGVETGYGFYDPRRNDKTKGYINLWGKGPA